MPLADIYKMIAGTMVFVIFVSVSLIMMAGTFSDLAPTGFNEGNLNKIAEPQPPIVNATNCDIVTLCLNMIIGPVINFVGQAWTSMTAVTGMAVSIFTFDIPAFAEMGPLGVLFRLLIMIPMLLAIGLMIFFTIKSVIPTVGGNAS